MCVCDSIQVRDYSAEYIHNVSSVCLNWCASLPDTMPAPKLAGTFALWLQFPGRPNLRQLLRTCYLCQQCKGCTDTSAAFLSPSGREIEFVHVYVRAYTYMCEAHCIFNSSNICICICICLHGCTTFLMCIVCSVPVCVLMH